MSISINVAEYTDFQYFFLIKRSKHKIFSNNKILIITQQKNDIINIEINLKQKFFEDN